MPLYEFSCTDCGEQYEELARYDEKGVYEGVQCPQCGSAKKERLMSAVSYNFSNPVGTDRWNSESSGHDYRFHHNLPNVIEERKRAEEASTMGRNPYPKIDDVSSGKHFGEVK